jgi:hypothetical protein
MRTTNRVHCRRWECDGRLTMDWLMKYLRDGHSGMLAILAIALLFTILLR